MLSKKEQKLIKSLKIKKYRIREKRFLVEGAKNVLELINSNFKIDFLVGTHAFFEDQEEVLSMCRYEIVKVDLLSQLGYFKANSTVLAVVHMEDDETGNLQIQDSLFMLDGVSDPGNLGTIIRTLDWFGFHTLVCSMDCADFYNPKTIASTMGSFTRVKVIYRDLASYPFAQHGLPIYAADMDGENLFSFVMEQPCIIVMGSESHGVSAALIEAAKGKISIPNFGTKVESLNVGVATGIIASQLRISK